MSTCTCDQTHTHACMHTHTHTHAHTRMHARTPPPPTHTHTRTHACTTSLSCLWTFSLCRLPLSWKSMLYGEKKQYITNIIMVLFKSLLSSGRGSNLQPYCPQTSTCKLHSTSVAATSSNQPWIHLTSGTY